MNGYQVTLCILAYLAIGILTAADVHRVTPASDDEGAVGLTMGALAYAALWPLLWAVRLGCMLVRKGRP